MSEERQERCENRRFWQRKTESDFGEEHTEQQMLVLLTDDTGLVKIGECHRYPPTWDDPQSGNVSYAVATLFPVTTIHEWCGEFQVKHNPILDADISILNLSVRAQNCIECEIARREGNWRKERPTLVGDVLRFTVSELRSIKNMGNTTLKEIVDKLSLRGLKLKDY